MKHSDISLALDALGEKFGITLKQRPNYSHGRVHLQLTTLEQPVVSIDLDESLFHLVDRRELSDKLHRHFEDVSRLLCGALIVNAATFGQEPKFMLDALPVDRRREICDALARAFLDLAAGDELKEQREWLHRRLRLSADVAPEQPVAPPVVPQKTHRRTIVLGEFNDHYDERHVRLFSEPDKEGDTYWVDFQVFEIAGQDYKPGTSEPGSKFFNRKGAKSTPDPVYTYEEAQPIVDGFVKWDGCTQFDFPDGVHIDGKRHMESLFAAVCEARRAAAELMGPTWDCRKEYE